MAFPAQAPNVGRSVEHWRRVALLRSGDVELNLVLPRARFWEEESSSVLTSPLEPRRSTAVPSTISTLSLL